MTDAELTQRLVGILVADAAGYSRLMVLDERATVAALDSARVIYKARIETHQRLGAVDLWTMRLAPHRRAGRGQRFALPTAPAFAHKLHRAPPPFGEQDEHGNQHTRGA
jgi:hypothetical protein